MENFEQKLGRLYIPDERDGKYQMKMAIPQETPGVTYKYWWPTGWWGNQQNTPYCVAFSWAHWLAAGPITQKKSREGGVAPFDTTYLYNEAQKVDEWPGEDYDGTSVRAGAKILKSSGYISNYLWAWNVETVIQALLTAGPVVVGTWWYDGMFYPDSNGLIKTTGSKVGGHAYLLDGVNTDKGLIRIKNSWGRNWGKNGFAYISFDDMETLIFDQGEACLSTEIDVI